MATPRAYRDDGSVSEWQLGADRLVRVGLAVEIYTSIEMPELSVRGYRPRPVLLDGEMFGTVQPESTESQLFRVIAHDISAAGVHRYRLEPWPDSYLPSVAPLRYNEAFAQAREQRQRAEKLEPFITLLLMVVAPIGGLLPSPLLERLHERLGLHPSVAVRASLFLEALLLFGVGGGLALHGYTGLAVLSLFVLGADTLMRSTALARDVPLGFFEWVFRRT